jgi:cell fate (sporulation/competence/biofilm development) regulator YlbF (YheA/YmcA/DUF963 family)
MMDERLQQATEQLGRALRASAPVRAYLDASTNLETDVEATGLLDELAQRQAALRVKQNDGGLTQAAIDDLRALQFRVQTQPTIAAYLQAQQDVRALLPQINYEISQLLGVDFAALARKSGCC